MSCATRWIWKNLHLNWLLPVKSDFTKFYLCQCRVAMDAPLLPPYHYPKR
jgi:hypothetical protein